MSHPPFCPPTGSSAWSPPAVIWEAEDNTRSPYDGGEAGEGVVHYQRMPRSDGEGAGQGEPAYPANSRVASMEGHPLMSGSYPGHSQVR